MSDLKFSRKPDKKRILVADDEASVREVLADFLRLEGHEVELAEDGQVALDKLQESPFDIVLSDMEMPVMNGLQLLRACSKLHHAPLVIIMTGYGTVETAIDAMKNGAWDYLLKPFQINQLAVVIERACEHRQLSAENLELRASSTLFEASNLLLSPGLVEHDLLNILEEGLLSAGNASALRIWLHVDEGEWQPRPSLGREELLAWINDDLFSSTDKVQIMKACQEPQAQLLQTGTMTRIFTNHPPENISLILATLQSSGKLLGIIVLANAGNKQFLERDRKAIQMLASRTASGIKNRRLAEELRSNVLETIAALVSALEAKDDYTKGHSLRVAKWAVLIAQQMQLPEEDIEYIRIAAVLHDIGKIGINLTALNKAGKLTEEEYKNFKMHPVLSKNILEPIQFLKPVLPLVFYHHERVDGQGYPLGIEGGEIPIGARILAVADSFEVMVTNRVYRHAMRLQDARDELRRNCGTQFDNQVVAALLDAIKDCEDLEDLPISGGREEDDTGSETVPYNSPVS